MSEHPEHDACLPHQHELSEAQLRHLYDEEEIERFISSFSTYVTEARLSTVIANPGSHTLGNMDAPRTSIPSGTSDHSLSEEIAYNYILPHLPQVSGVESKFTLNRLRLTTQRLYLALFPPYKTFLLNLAQLALWKDYQRSLRYCIVFWFLWFRDLLLPALLFRIVFALLRHRLSTFPTLKGLQERRQENLQALKFGEAVQQRLSATTLGPIEAWRLFKLYRLEGECEAKPDSKEAFDIVEEDLKRDMLQALHELADLHERVKNIFAWRRPAVSRRYLLFFTVIGFGMLVLPAHYIAKLLYWFGGILFWHVTPIVAALPRGDRTRLLSFLFGDAPTDADYAMELIAKRIAAGQDVDVASMRNQLNRTSHTPASTDTLVSTLYFNSHEVRTSEDGGTNWKKWGERAARGKAFLGEGRQFLSTYTSRNPILGDTAFSRLLEATDGRAFLAEHASSPGSITLSPSTLFFTPLMGAHARLVIPRDRLRHVKKSGLAKGISITWAPAELMDGEEREDKFRWVGNRDELFARLVGSDGGRWTTA